MIGNLFVISGPSGVGKDTLMALIFKSIPTLERWITCTTRHPRKGEIDGKDYFFKSKDEFNQMLTNNQLVEWNEFAGNLYGTPKQFAIDKLNAGVNIITAIDVHGAANVKKTFPNAHLIFIEPPSLEELRSRLVKRGSDSKESIEKRLQICKDEFKQKQNFDISFINDNLKNTANEIVGFINKTTK